VPGRSSRYCGGSLGRNIRSDDSRIVTIITPAYSCPAGITTQKCSYLTDIFNAGLPVPANALNAAVIICEQLNDGHGISVGEQAALFQSSHPGLTIGQATTYIEITQGDMCPQQPLDGNGIRG
jgi:hypothetical protein